MKIKLCVLIITVIGSQGVVAQDTLLSGGSGSTQNLERIGYRKETILKRRIKKESKKEIVIKGYYQEVIGTTTQMDPPQPIYGKKKRFKRVESTVRDKGFRRKFGI
ncbi:MAG: hypothetical protein ACI865_000106 [Flavobacteriaceae bacterium]|jgi:hypothetical protein